MTDSPTALILGAGIAGLTAGVALQDMVAGAPCGATRPCWGDVQCSRRGPCQFDSGFHLSPAVVPMARIGELQNFLASTTDEVPIDELNQFAIHGDPI